MAQVYKFFCCIAFSGNGVQEQNKKNYIFIAEATNAKCEMWKLVLRWM
jgi:hypothetical protein